MQLGYSRFASSLLASTLHLVIYNIIIITDTLSNAERCEYTERFFPDLHFISQRANERFPLQIRVAGKQISCRGTVAVVGAGYPGPGIRGRNRKSFERSVLERHRCAIHDIAIRTLWKFNERQFNGEAAIDCDCRLWMSYLIDT